VPRREPALTAGDLRQKKDLAVRGDRLEESVLVDLPVNGDRNAFAQVRRDLRIQLGQLLEQLVDGRHGELKLGDAPREPREIADQDHSSHA